MDEDVHGGMFKDTSCRLKLGVVDHGLSLGLSGKQQPGGLIRAEVRV